MADRLMSDAQLRHRKKVQAHTSQVTGTLGLAALGATLAGSRQGVKALKLKPKTVGHLKSLTTPLLATSGGVGGVGAFNSAAISDAESRKRKVGMTTTVKKDYETPIFGEVAKAWEPVKGGFDAEANRHNRAKKLEGGLTAGAGVAIGASTASLGQSALDERRSRKLVSNGRAKHKAFVAESSKLRASSVKNLKGAGKLAAVGVGLAGAATGVNRARKSKGFQTYSKSAFGVSHD